MVALTGLGDLDTVLGAGVVAAEFWRERPASVCLESIVHQFRKCQLIQGTLKAFILIRCCSDIDV